MCRAARKFSVHVTRLTAPHEPGKPEAQSSPPIIFLSIRTSTPIQSTRTIHVISYILFDIHISRCRRSAMCNANSCSFCSDRWTEELTGNNQQHSVTLRFRRQNDIPIPHVRQCYHSPQQCNDHTMLKMFFSLRHILFKSTCTINYTQRATLRVYTGLKIKEYCTVCIDTTLHSSDL